MCVCVRWIVFGRHDSALPSAAERPAKANGRLGVRTDD